MMEEPEFFLDDEYEKKQEELKQAKEQLELLIKKVQDPKLESKVMFYKSFAKGMVLAVKKQKTKKRISLFPKKTETKPKQKKLPSQKLPEKHKTIAPWKKLKKQFKELPKKPETKELIRDKFTGNVLATSEIKDNIYHIKEPVLDEKDKKALEKIMKKNPKKIPKAWKLILKYGKKFKIEKGHEENLKYYVINRFFAMGKIEPLLHDENITEIKCSGVEKPIKVIYNGKEYETNLKFNNSEEFEIFLEIISKKTGKKIDKKNKILEAEHRNYKINVTRQDIIANSNFSFKKL